MYVGISAAMSHSDNNEHEAKPTPRHQEILSLLQRGEIRLPPTEITLYEAEPLIKNSHHRPGGILRVGWKRSESLFVFEYKAVNTPRIQAGAIAQVNLYANLMALPPLIIVPYLSEEALLELERSNTSGVDLCGNGLLIGDSFRYWRSGQPNLYTDSRPIRNPFYGDSSLFARCFLLRDRFASLQELQQFAHERTFAAYPAIKPTGLTQGTASKVVQALADELVVRRDGSGLHRQDRGRLLTLLRRGYRKPDPPRVIGSSPLSPERVWELLNEERQHGSLRAVATGLSSAGHYKALSGTGRLGLYVSDLNAAATLLQVRTGRAFANIEIAEERKNLVYFDARHEGHRLWASPIQTWLELRAGGPREQEAAEILEHLLT